MKPLTLAAAFALTACSAGIIGDPGTGPGAPDAPGDCGAYALQYLVGQSRDVLASMTLPAPVRTIGPDTAVTMDFNPQRLNIRYDEGGIIREVYCG